MTEDRDITRSLLQAASNASSEPTVEERNHDFATLLRSTRQNFRRPDPMTTTPTKGRKRKRSFKKKVVLLKLAHAEFFPCNAELRFLKQRGLGEPENTVEIIRSHSLEDISDSIISLFPTSIQNLLRMCGFKIGKAEKSKKITIINNIVDGSMLETEIGQGKIVLLPKKDFPDDLPILNSHLTTNQPTVNPRPSTPISTRIDNDINLGSPQPAVTRPTVSLRPRVLRMNEPVVEVSDEEDSDDELSIVEENIELNQVVFPSLPENAGVTNINISRSSCYSELMKIYTDDEIVDTKLNVHFNDEMGIDAGGLTKEVFNIFFEQCESLFFLGEDCIIPYLPLNRRSEVENYVQIGRVLQHMLVLTGTIPSKLSKITLILVANPDANIKADMLWEEILHYVNPYLRKILKKGKKNFSSLSDTEERVIQEFYQTNKFYAKPSPESFTEQILTIADEVLIQTPRRLILKLREGVSPAKYSNFWSNCDFNVLIDMQLPTPTKIVNCLHTDDYLTNEEDSVLHYFTMYIHCLDTEKLRKLIFLITGSYVMPSRITVHFNDTVGFSQRFEFSTCATSITLPKTYANFNELKNDLNCFLASKQVHMYSTY